MNICCAGEVMIEMAPEGHAGLFRQGVAGDTYNTAVYLARLGLDVSYLSRLGTDALSATIMQQLQVEGIDGSMVARCKGREAGLYLIHNRSDGEREFHYWRSASPARELFDQPLQAPQVDAFYFSGITLAVVRSGLDHLCNFLEQLRRGGSTVCFDPNFRPRLWRDLDQAHACYREILPYCDILLPTLEDERALWQVQSAAECHELYREYNPRELVIKGDDLVTFAFAADTALCQQAHCEEAVDTTGAGDAFNAAYLGSRLQGGSIATSIDAAQALAAVVVQHRGAIAPRSATRALGY